MDQLYDTPAQADFMNTYVPIKFDGLYKMEDRDREDRKDLENLIDTRQAAWNKINPVSTADTNYLNHSVGATKSMINDIVGSGEGLTGYEGQAKIKNAIRALSSDATLNNITNTADAQKAFVANSDARYGTWEADQAKNWDTSKQGAFSLRNRKYKTLEEMADEDANKVNKAGTLLGVKFDAYGRKEINGWDWEHLNPMVSQTAKDIANSEEGNATIQAMIHNNEIPSNFMKKSVDKDGNAIIVPDINAYLQAKVATRYAPLIHSLDKYEQIDYGKLAAEKAKAAGTAGAPTSYLGEVNKATLVQSTMKAHDLGRNKALSGMYGEVGDMYKKAHDDVNKYRNMFTGLSTDILGLQNLRHQTTDPNKIKEIDNRIASTTADRDNAQNALRTASDNYSKYERVIDSNTDTYQQSIGRHGNPFTAKDAEEMRKVELPPLAANTYLNAAYGEPHNLVSGTGQKPLKMYNAQHPIGLKIATPQGIELTGSHADAWNKAISNTDIYIDPTSHGSRSGSELRGSGYGYIPKTKVDAMLKSGVITPKQFNVLAHKKQMTQLELAGAGTDLDINGVNLTTGGAKTGLIRAKQTYYKIPVSYPINSDQASPISQVPVTTDALVAKKAPGL